MASKQTDEKLMRTALGLARRGLGYVAPNPAVGCVIARDGRILGRGWTQPGGRPHAETMALKAACEKPAGATAYVTLEPCAHTGQTGPCASALIKAGIARCVVATEDPDPRVAGKGILMMRDAGIDVETSVLEAEARAVNAGFFSKITLARPMFTLKLASSLDGRIALENGDSKWITGPEARRFGHLLRMRHDAILVGSNTVMTDNPSLDCRIKGLEGASPKRIILDGRLRVTPDHKVAGDGTVLFHTTRDEGREQALEAIGVRLVYVPDTKALGVIASKLAEMGITRVLVEGGGLVHASFLQAGMVDAVEHFSAGLALGADSKAAIGGLGLASLADAPHLTLISIRRLGADLLASYVKAE